jgi:hypothetical protein
MHDRTQSATLSITRSFFSRSHDAVIRVLDEVGSEVETHEYSGDFREP